MDLEREFAGPNYGYILELYERYQDNPDSVDEATRSLFARWKPAEGAPSIRAGLSLSKIVGVVNLAQAIRSYGYLAAKLDPLGNLGTGDPVLSPGFHGLDQQDLVNAPPELAGLPADAAPPDASEAIGILRSIYCGAIGYDYGQVHNPDERAWLQQVAETGHFRGQGSTADQKHLLERLSQVEALEVFLNRIYPGKTRFSIEGLDMLVPMLDEMVGKAVQAKICVILLGMAHRGRLNVLAHILHQPYEQILAEFRDPKDRSTTWDELGWTGDVKYHMGGYKSPEGANRVDLVIDMPANPSHLELVDPFIQGMSRAANSKVDKPGQPQTFPNASLPILVHGDASFVGQGIVAETLNLTQLPGYSTEGALHIITNNQLGFTATDKESRSSLYASDLAKGFEIPIIHVNADEPEACMEAVRTAFAYRQRFHKDFVVDLIGYRRYGHNEGDEPRFTQPVMYRAIDQHPTVRQLWVSRLEQEGAISSAEAENMLQSHLTELQEISQQLNAGEALHEPVPKVPPSGAARKVNTAVPLEKLKSLNEALRRFPEGFHPNSKLSRAVQRRQRIFEDPDGNSIDWATAEELAFASILADGIAIRMTGQDTPRGTFSQRHAVFFDTDTNQVYTPLQSIPQAKASFEIHNSPVSEAGPVSFEVGYNIQAPDRLVLWEAQYGDFINNAQAVIDEFLLSGRAKWGLTPSLVLLLPQGNEGMGPDHSSARIERFLGLAAEGNMRAAIPTTAAQYFHLLRRQALLLKRDPLPLVMFTPKGFLRHPMSASMPSQLASGSWQPLLEEPEAERKEEAISHLILCSGRIYFDLIGSKLRSESKHASIVRIEQLYPFPADAAEKMLTHYPKVEQVVWVQEEPLNMGAWNYLRPLLRQLLGDRVPLYYVGRPPSSSPAEGSSTLYAANQEALIARALQITERTDNRSVVVERG